MNPKLGSGEKDYRIMRISSYVNGNRENHFLFERHFPLQDDFAMFIFVL
jgi:hypothetical protein